MLNKNIAMLKSNYVMTTTHIHTCQENTGGFRYATRYTN